MKRLCFRGHGFYTGRRCPGCERQRDTARGTSTQRGYDSAYRLRRREIIEAEPWCHTPGGCPYGDGGTRANPLTADHVNPRGPAWAAGPLVPLCKRCNSGKRDRAAGRASRTAGR